MSESEPDDDPIVTLNIPGVLADYLIAVESPVAWLLTDGKVIHYGERGYSVKLTTQLSLHELILSAARALKDPEVDAPVAVRRAYSKYTNRVRREQCPPTKPR